MQDDLSDDRLERQIKAELDACESARNRNDLAQAHTHWQEFVKLISQRSPKQVWKMERRRGLG